MKTSLGFSDDERGKIAVLYWEAFGLKLNIVMGPDHRGIAFVNDVLDPTHALRARDDDGHLLGVAGFKTHDGTLVGGKARDMAKHYGWVSSLWRIGLISLLERDTENARFLWTRYLSVIAREAKVLARHCWTRCAQRQKRAATARCASM